jgi:energy-coupling factor transport system ATP-binding protein
VLAARGVEVTYPGVGPVLRGVDLEVAPDERLHVGGRNGGGKSTLLACLAGAIEPDAGTVEVAGRRVDRRASLVGTVGFLLQNPQRQLFEETVAAEVAFSLKRLRLAASEVERRVAQALDLCEAGHLARRLPLSLSFGEQHRVALASALAPGPRVLLLDEPFSGLDMAQRLRLLRILASLRERHGTAVVIASHDPVLDPAWPDRIVTLQEGRLA